MQSVDPSSDESPRPFAPSNDAADPIDSVMPASERRSVQLMLHSARRFRPWRLAMRCSAGLATFVTIFLLAISPADDPVYDQYQLNSAGILSPISTLLGDSQEDVLSTSPQLISTNDSQTLWRMYFATNRELIKDDSSKIEFGDRARRLRFGLATVSIPTEHERGMAEAQQGWLPFSFWAKDKGAISVSSERILEEEVVLESLRDTIRALPKRELLIVVHGYNVTHDAAVSRTCQIAHDLPFDGAVLAFTWPSAGRLDGYFRDENNATFSEAEFAELIGVLRRSLPAHTKIHILAHSMGNRVVLGGLSALAGFVPGPDVPKIHHLILAAPDVGLVRFESELNRVSSLVHSVSLYTSIRDNALVLSHAIHGEARAGQLTDVLLRMDGLETFDVSAVDESLLGHSYYGSSVAVLNDLYMVFTQDRMPQDCSWFLQRPGHIDGFYWSFVGPPPRQIVKLTEQTKTEIRR